MPAATSFHASCRRARAGTFLVLTLVLLGAAPAALAQDPPYIPPGYVLVDDMILPQSAVYGEANFNGTPWTNGIVPFTFAANVSAANQARALTAMAELEAVANVDFVPRTNQADFIRFVDANGNSSFVGVIGGQQDVNIFNWTFKYIIVHELLHALSFNHEHVRPDRGNFVTINFQNIVPANAFNFTLDNNATTVGNYDFLSIMHYGRTAFSANGQDTITCLPAFAQFQNQIGNRTFMTANDAGGVANRYGNPAAPAISGISPAAVVQNSAAFTLTVDGSRFLEGSPDGNGVQGSRVRWNGQALPTTYVNPGRLTATVAASLVDYPQSVEVTVENQAPGGGVSNVARFTVSCPPGPVIALQANVPQAVTTPCTTFNLSPVAGAWNVVGITSTADWDVNIGAANAWFGTGTCDFAVANGQLGAITPAFGEFPRWSGSAAATAEHRASSSMSIGVPRDTSMPAGAVVRAFHFTVPAAASFDINVTGGTNLGWLLYGPGSNAAWRADSTMITSATVGTGPVNGVALGAGSHCIVVAKNGGAGTADVPFTVNVCSATPPLALAESFNGLTITNSCQPITVTPVAGAWNVVGISSASDWDVTIGQAESQSGTGTADFVVANGHLGAVSPTAGLFARFSGAASAIGHLGDTQLMTLNSTLAATWSGNQAVRVFEFDVPCATSVDITVSGSAFLSWHLFTPGTASGWRIRSQATLSGTASAAVNTVALQAGWHAIAVARNGGAGASGSVNVTLGPATYPAPVLTSMSPTSASAGSPALTLTVTGSGFACTSLVRWNGANLATTFVSATQLTAVVPAANLATGAARSVTVHTPPFGGGTSAVLTFSVNNPAPVLTSISPATALAGAAALTLTLNGSGFVTGSSARWGATSLTTTFVSAAQITAAVPASLLAAAGTFSVTVVNAAPGGGTSAARTFTVSNPAPVLASIAPSSAIAGGAAFALTLSGSGFTGQSVARWNGASLATTFVSATQLTASIAASRIAAAGTASLTVFNPAPGGGTSAARTFTINNPAPVAVSIAPASAVAGGPALTVNVDGSGFVAASAVRWNGSALVTTFVSATQLQAAVPAALIAAPGSATITVFNAAPGGGASAGLAFGIVRPVIFGVLPAQVAVMAPAAPPVPLSVSGLSFAPGARICANGQWLPTTFVSASQLTAVLDTSVPQGTRPGAIAITVENAPDAVSNTYALEVGPGSNRGTVRRHPLVPVAGQAYAAVIDGGTPNAVMSLYVDTGNPAPVTAWPDPSADLVLAVGPFAGSSVPLLPLVEGIGIYAPATGASLDANGSFSLPGFVLPNPALGVDVTVQGIYLDPAAPYGFRLTYARWPDRI